MTTPSAQQIHERILLIGATVGLACAANLPWWEYDTRVYSGWGQVDEGGSGFSTGWEQWVHLSASILVLVLLAATLCRPYLISTTLATAFAVVAGFLTVALVCFAYFGGGRDDVEIFVGQWVATGVAGTVCALWVAAAHDPWPRATVLRTDNPFELDRGLWVREFARYAPVKRPLAVVEIGSDLGHFAPRLADEFGGSVYGVDSTQHHKTAQVVGAHERVTYLDGSFDAIPLPDESCDVAVAIDPFQRFAGQQFTLDEVKRVLRPGGVLLVRSQFADLMPDLHWYRYFPSARQIDVDAQVQSSHARELAAKAGLVADPEAVEITADVVRSLKASYERCRRQRPAALKGMPADELEEGFARFEEAAATDPSREILPATATLLVIRRV
jgi:ubiquinone/menaquinone biosynthesis C-methylase UbiE